MDPIFLLASLSLAWFTMFFSNSSFSFRFLLPPPGLAGLVEGFTLTGLTPRSERSVAEDSSPLLFSPVFTIFEHFFEELFGVDVEIFCWRLCEDILLLEKTQLLPLIAGLVEQLFEIDHSDSEINQFLNFGIFILVQLG